MPISTACALATVARGPPALHGHKITASAWTAVAGYFPGSVGVAHYGLGQRVLALALQGGQQRQQDGGGVAGPGATKVRHGRLARVMVPVLSSSTVFTW